MRPSGTNPCPGHERYLGESSWIVMKKVDDVVNQLLRKVHFGRVGWTEEVNYSTLKDQRRDRSLRRQSSAPIYLPSHFSTRAPLVLTDRLYGLIDNPPDRLPAYTVHATSPKRTCSQLS